MKEFNKLVQDQMKKLEKTGKLFTVELSGREVWDLYLNSFSNDENPTFRDPESSTYNCNHCKNFIRRYGNVVAVNSNNKLITLFDFKGDGDFKGTAETLSKAIKKSKIKDVFFETYNELNSLPYESCSKNNEVFRLGVEKNSKIYSKEEAEIYGVVEEGEVRTFNHFHMDLSKRFVDKTGKSIESIRGNYRANKEVFKRAMDEISLDTLRLVKDLINQGSLLNGDSHIGKVDKMLPLMEQYSELAKNQQDNWSWVSSYGFSLSKFKNELIGVLCSDLSEGKDLVTACKEWNKRVDPKNYMKASAPITQRQIDDAKKFVIDNGYTESFNRRLATIDDIKVTEIKHINNSKESLTGLSIFDNVKSTSTRHKKAKFDNIEEVTIDNFMNKILPSCSKVEVFVENRQENNLVSLTTTNVENSKKIFKWDNNYSWTFKGNLAGKSEIKDAVSNNGGKVDGVLRFSIMWSDGDGDNSDLDAHCKEPNGNVIYYSKKVSRVTGGNLDIDIMDPESHRGRKNKDVVENITFPSLSRMTDGKYIFKVHQYSARKSKGFKAEIEFNGEVFNYDYSKEIGSKKFINVAEVTLKDGEFKIKHLLPEINSSKEIYGIETNEFHKVDLVCLSPNHWGENKVGNKHYFFMIDKCKADENLRSFHNENLNSDLLKHRKVMEVLGETNKIDNKSITGKQLSGLGFNSTVRDEVVLRLSGNFNRVVKVKF